MTGRGRADVMADLGRLLGELEGLASAAQARPDVVAELLDGLAVRQRRLGPDEELVADGLLTVEAAAEWLALGETAVRGLLESGALRCCRIGRAVRIPRRALVRYAAELLTTPRADP